jgi:hypothetical protein
LCCTILTEKKSFFSQFVMKEKRAIELVHRLLFS